MMTRNMVAAAAIALACATAAQAQKFEWTETQNLPKGQNMPSGITADILGVEVGMSYKDAKTVFERLLAEAPQRDQRQRSGSTRMLTESTGANNRDGIKETESAYTLGPARASYVSELQLTRRLPGVGKQGIVESLEAKLSAPSSGHQVVFVSRSVSYLAAEDQPKVSETVAALQKKFGSVPSPDVTYETGKQIAFAFNSGAAVPLNKPSGTVCGYGLVETVIVNGAVKSKPVRGCDVLLTVRFSYGFSKDHASAIEFFLNDQARAKANDEADQAFINGYLRKMQENTRGAPPKL